LSASFEEISHSCGRAVVEILGRTYAREGSENGGALLTTQNSSGSGIVVSPDGYILTNAHVVRASHNLRVCLSFREAAEMHPKDRGKMDRALPAAIIGIDSETDLAVIKVNRTNLPYLPFGDSDRLKQGQVVLALGNPLGLNNSVSLGVVSAIARQLKSDDPLVYIQTDAPINPGNSGGPLVDADGDVVGINTFILTQSGGSEGIGFAIPSNIARQVYTQLKTQGHVHRSQLGLVAQTINPVMADGLGLETDHGVIVSDLKPTGPAASAGLKPEDIVLALNGKRIASAGQLEADVYRQMPGQRVVLRIQRGANQLDVAVSTEEESDHLQDLADTLDPSKNTVPELGIVGLDLTRDVRQYMPDARRPAGVVVAARNADVPYSASHLEISDIIYEVNRHVVANVDELRNTLQNMKSGDAVVLLVERDGRLVYVPLELN
jgi:serine protease Do